MFEGYQQLVMRTYRQKWAESSLSLNLMYPTPARIKAECLAVCRERFIKKDEKTLRLFFGLQPDREAYLYAIKLADPDQFKPLRIFLKDGTVKTKEQNVELLAWLIDFELRPHEPLRSYEETGIRPTIPESSGAPVATHKNGQETDGKTFNDSPVAGEGAIHEVNVGFFSLKYRQKRIKAIAIAALLVIVTGIGYGTWYASRREHRSGWLQLKEQEQCMFWAGDHFQPVSCRQKLGDTMVVALDEKRLAGFKKILKPDTLTRNSLGKVWYFKLRGHLEFYTSAGDHPVYPDRRVLPMSEHILRTYVLNN